MYKGLLKKKGTKKKKRKKEEVVWLKITIKYLMIDKKSRKNCETDLGIENSPQNFLKIGSC